MVSLRIGTAGDIERAAVLASLLEVSASPKPGNVHRLSLPRDHPMAYEQFLAAIAALAPHYSVLVARTRSLAEEETPLAGKLGLGGMMRRAMESMVAWQGAGNLLLGHVLLLFPLAAAAAHATKPRQDCSLSRFKQSLSAVLASGSPADVIEMYKGMRACMPGGLGSVGRFDINSPGFEAEIHAAGATFIDVFATREEDDLICHEWCHGFPVTLGDGFPYFMDALGSGASWNDSIVQLFLYLLSARPDSLVARKSGLAAAEDVRRRAGVVMDAGGVFTPRGRQAAGQLECHLLAAGGKLNPGTTADLVAAAVFMGLLAGMRP